MTITADAIGIRRLHEMLEGQVAVLSSGALTPGESLALVETLRNSSLYRTDQNSYILYPDRPRPRFLEKNNLPHAWTCRCQATISSDERSRQRR